MIKAVFFDFGDVLAEDGYKIAKEYICHHTNVTHHQVEKAFDNPLWHDWDRGFVSSKEYWAEVQKILGEKHARDLHKVFLKKYQVRPYMISLAENLKSDFRIGILSNMVAEVQVFEKIRNRFDAAIFSFEVGLRKPEKAIYLLAAEKIDCQPEECLLIDDKESNVKGALESGFEGIRFYSYEQLLNELEKRKIWNASINI